LFVENKPDGTPYPAAPRGRGHHSSSFHMRNISGSLTTIRGRHPLFKGGDGGGFVGDMLLFIIIEGLSHC